MFRSKNKDYTLEPRHSPKDQVIPMTDGKTHIKVGKRFPIGGRKSPSIVSLTQKDPYQSQTHQTQSNDEAMSADPENTISQDNVQGPKMQDISSTDEDEAD